MIPNNSHRKLEGGGITESAAFGISAADSAHLMGILRDAIYTDRIMAVLREYGANCWDAHRQCGKADVPIRVKLPTAMDPVLSISDEGPGLSHEDVFNVYTQYGASTKRGTDLAVGMLGIGCKSAFSYSDTFTIISRFEGLERTYVAVLDESDRGVVNLLGETPCGVKTGVTVQIPVKSGDFYEFREKAGRLFKYFTPQPIIDMPLEDPDVGKRRLKHGSISEQRDYSGTWVAVMGCVPYRVDLNQLRGEKLPNGGIGDYLNQLSGAVYFDIGEVAVGANREELKYTDQTRKALVEKFDELVTEFVSKLLEGIDLSSCTEWDRLVRLQLLSKLSLPFPKQFKDLTRSNPCMDIPSQIASTTRSYLHPSDRTKILIRDDDEKKKKLRGYALNGEEMIVTPMNSKTIAEVRKAVDEAVIKAKVSGIPIALISTVPWTKPQPKFKRPVSKNEKHKLRTFVYNQKSALSGKPSAAWDIESRVPLDTDVFVILEHFSPTCVGNTLYEQYSEMTAMATMFGGKVPPVYGYKTTKAKPVDASKCKGKLWLEWKKKFPASIISLGNNEELAETFVWSQVCRSSTYRDTDAAMKHASDRLGADHPFVSFHEKSMTASAKTKKLAYRPRELTAVFCRILTEDGREFQAHKAQAELYALYPVLTITDIPNVSNEKIDVLIDYILLVDAERRATKQKEEEENVQEPPV